MSYLDAVHENLAEVDVNVVPFAFAVILCPTLQPLQRCH